MLDFLNKNKNKREVYIILSLQESGAEALLCSYDTDVSSVSVLGRESFSFSDGWERLVEDVDEVLYRLEQAANVKADKCMVYLFSHLVDITNKTIKEPYFKKINDMVSEMGIEMVGFMECHEVLFAHLTKTGSGVFSGILCEIDGSSVTVLVYRNGLLDFEKTIARTDDYIDRLDTEFVNLAKTKTLPLRIVIYGIGSVEKDGELFSNKKWSHDTFVQLPRVEVITPPQLEEAIIASFGDQVSIGSNKQVLTSFVQSDQSEVNQEVVAVEEKKVIAGFTIGADAVSEINEVVPEAVSSNNLAVNSGVSGYQNDNVFVTSNYKVSQTNGGKFGKLSSIKIGGFSFTGLLVVLVGIALIIVAIFAILNSYHKADLTFIYDTKPISSNVVVNGRDVSLALKTKEVKESGSIETTGIKFVGEKSKGEISILNKDKKEVTIPKGTVLTGPKNLKFVLESEVKVASASEELTSGGDVLTVTGKEKGTIIASEIGEEYNLGKDTKFEFPSFSASIVATATKSITGGSKKEVRTASKADFDKLKSEVMGRIKTSTKKIVDESADVQIVTVLTQVTAVDEKYSAELAEESSELSLDLTAKVKYYTLPIQKTREVLSQKLEKSVPKDQTLISQAISFSVKSAAIKSGKPVLTLVVKGTPRKKVDEKELKKTLIGKPVSQIGDISTRFDAVGYEYRPFLDLPILNKWLPFFGKNLNISIKTTK